MQPDLIQSRIDDISDRIRQVREVRGYTLVQLGQVSGVAPSTIQKIENRQMTPSIAILLKVAAGLEVEPPELIAPMVPAPLDLIVQRASHHPQIKASPSLVFEKLSADLAACEVEVWRVSIAPHHAADVSPPWRLDEHVFVCECGKIALIIDGETVEMAGGDSLHFRAKTISRVSNAGDEPASYLFAGKYPHGLRENLVTGVRDAVG